MARKSRWQQFSDNFNSVYDTFNKAAQNIETSRIMDDEKFTSGDGLGAGLEGSALEKARYKALGDIYTKYGNAEQGLAMRNQLATLDAAERENTINQTIMQELIDQRGALQSGLMRGQTNAANASANASNAGAANSRSLVVDRNATRPYRLEGLGLANDGTRIENANAQLAYNLGMATFGSDVDTANAGARLAIANADTAETGAENAAATKVSDQDAANSTNALAVAQATLGIDTAEAALKNATTEDRILSKVMGSNFETGAEADAAAIAEIQQSDLPYERKATLISIIQKMGLETLANEGAQFTQAGLNALGQGLDAGIKWYDGVDDGNTLAIERDEDGTVRVMETRGDAVRELFSASGDTAEQQILAQLATQIQQPSNALAVAASVAEINNTQANTDNTESRTALIDIQTFTEMFAANAVQARTNLVNAQTDRVRKEIESAKGGLSASREIAEKGLASLVGSEAYLYMGSAEQAAAVAQYRRAMGMEPDPPTPEELAAMTPEQQALFRVRNK
jgi:hypothetical protein